MLALKFKNGKKDSLVELLLQECTILELFEGLLQFGA